MRAWCILLAWPVMAAGPEPLELDDLRLLLQMRVPAQTIAELAKARCVTAPLNSAVAGELVKLGATAELIGLLAESQCKKETKPQVIVEKCPQSHMEDPAGKGCIDFRRGSAYMTLPPEKAGRCVVDVMVDGVTDFVLRGTLLLYEVQSAGPPKDINSNCSQPFPSRDVRPSLGKERGRGTAAMLVQPGKDNGFSLRIRVQDDQKGRDHYRLLVDWVNP